MAQYGLAERSSGVAQRYGAKYGCVVLHHRTRAQPWSTALERIAGTHHWSAAPERKTRAQSLSAPWSTTIHYKWTNDPLLDHSNAECEGVYTHTAAQVRFAPSPTALQLAAKTTVFYTQYYLKSSAALKRGSGAHRYSASLERRIGAQR